MSFVSEIFVNKTQSYKERKYNLKNINTDENKKDDWNPKLYDNNHSFVSDYGSSLIEIIKS